jgi:DNA-binding protein H-NS
MTATAMSEKDQKELEKARAILAKFGQKAVPDDTARLKKAQEMLERWKKEAQDNGLTPGYVWFSGGKNGGKKDFKITHRNPDNASETWKGVGNIPKWAREKLGKKFAEVRDLSRAQLLELMAPFKVQ